MFFDWSSTLSLMVYPQQLINIIKESDRKKERARKRESRMWEGV